MSAPLAQPAVSVVVPVHEDSAALRECLAALRGQTLAVEQFEVIVCDNASVLDPVAEEDLSADGGLDEAQHPLTTLLRSATAGSYHARNRCFEVARGRVLAFTDADCRPHPDWLAEGLRALEGGGSVVAGRVSVYTQRTPPTPLELFERENAFPQERYVTTMGFGVTANLFVPREVFDAVGPFDEQLLSGGDREFCQRAGAVGIAVRYCATAVVDHPARATVAEVRAKSRRVLRGALAADGELAPLSNLVKRLRPPLGAGRRAFASPRLLTPRDRAMYVVGEVVAHYVRWGAEVRLRLHGA